MNSEPQWLENTAGSAKSQVFFHSSKEENLSIVELRDNFLSKGCGKRPRLGLIKVVFSSHYHIATR